MKAYTIQELNNFMVSRAAGSTESTEPLAQLSNQEILLIIEDTNTTPIYIYKGTVVREFLIYTDTTVIIRYATNTYEASNLARDEGYIVLNVQAK